MEAAVLLNRKRIEKTLIQVDQVARLCVEKNQ